MPRISERTQEVIPFSSETKYSGFVGESKNKYIMGAPEFIIKKPTTEMTKTIDQAAKKVLELSVF
jgi:High-affinity K+ transport system, ATPase chain B